MEHAQQLQLRPLHLARQRLERAPLRVPASRGRPVAQRSTRRHACSGVSRADGCGVRCRSGRALARRGSTDTTTVSTPSTPGYSQYSQRCVGSRRTVPAAWCTCRARPAASRPSCWKYPCAEPTSHAPCGAVNGRAHPQQHGPLVRSLGSLGGTTRVATRARVSSRCCGP